MTRYLLALLLCFNLGVSDLFASSGSDADESSSQSSFSSDPSEEKSPKRAHKKRQKHKKRSHSSNKMTASPASSSLHPPSGLPVLVLPHAQQDSLLAHDGSSSEEESQDGPQIILPSLIVSTPKRAILPLDGGGIRGYITALMLARLETNVRGILDDQDVKIAECFDLVAGTSAGAIAAACLTAPSLDNPARPRYDAQFLVEFYEGGRAGTMFERSLWQRVRSLFGLRDERYSSRPLREALMEYLGLTPLSQACVPTLITTMELSNEQRGSKPVFFRSYAQEDDPFRSIRAYEAAMCSGAAPTYFERMAVNDNDQQERYFIDGGLTGANNPTMVALAEIWRLYPELKKKDLDVVSVGTGIAPMRYNGRRAGNWGLFSWLQPIINITLGAPTLTTEATMETLFRKKGEDRGGYFRWSPDLADEIALDNASPQAMAHMKEVANTFMEARQEEFSLTATRLAANYRAKQVVSGGGASSASSSSFIGED